jgi:hypothetical protein
MIARTVEVQRRRCMKIENNGSLIRACKLLNENNDLSPLKMLLKKLS